MEDANTGWDSTRLTWPTPRALTVSWNCTTNCNSASASLELHATRMSSSNPPAAARSDPSSSANPATLGGSRPGTGATGTKTREQHDGAHGRHARATSTREGGAPHPKQPPLTPVSRTVCTTGPASRPPAPCSPGMRHRTLQKMPQRATRARGRWQTGQPCFGWRAGQKRTTEKRPAPTARGYDMADLRTDSAAAWFTETVRGACERQRHVWPRAWGAAGMIPVGH